MIKILLPTALSLLLFSCKKTGVKPEPLVVSHSQMFYKDLQNAEVKYLQPKFVDIDNDGSADFRFAVQLVGDPVLQRDRIQFNVTSGIQRNLLNNAQDESPKLNKLDSIKQNHPGYTWWQISSIVLAEKIVTYNGNTWEGLWKNANHNYLPVQVEKNGKLYHGWVELSFSTAEEKLILHRSALCTEDNKGIMAGV